MTIWMDLTNSLVNYTGSMVGIIRTELKLAKHLHNMDSDVRFFTRCKYGFREIKSKDLCWLWNTSNMSKSYLDFQKYKKSFIGKKREKFIHYKEKFEYKTGKHKFKKQGNDKRIFIIHPFKDGDIIYSCGSWDDKKEQFFVNLKKQLKRVKLVYTIYDLVLLKENLKFMYQPQDVRFEKYLQWISINCDGVVYCGQTAQIDAERYFTKEDLDIPKGKWLKFGGDIYNQNNGRLDSDNILKRMGIDKPYVLAVGSFDYKKNYRMLYQAYCQLGLKKCKNIPTLVIVGRSIANEMLKCMFVENPLIKEHIKIVSCTDDELDVLYNNCEFGILASLYEGYSDFLLETLGHGKFCLCSDVAPLKEVGQNFVKYINPNHPKDWADAIEFYMINKEEIKKQEENIKNNWTHYTWKDTINDLYKTLQNFQFEEKKQKCEQTKIYFDLGLFLLDGDFSGIPRAQMNLARYLNKFRKNDMKYFFLKNGEYFELSKNKLQNLLGEEHIDIALQKDKQNYRDFMSKEIPFTKETLVFSNGIGFDQKSYDLLFEMHKEKGFIYNQLIYDFTPITVPHTHTSETIKWYHLFLNNTYKLADNVFYGGKNAMYDGIKYQKDNGFEERPSYPIKFGSDIVSKKITNGDIDEVYNKYNIRENFILTVGTIQPRKNHEILYEAWLEWLRTKSDGEKIPQLVICGNRGWKCDEFLNILASDERIKNKVIFITPTDKELDVLYQTCKFTLLPSIYEGWSLTLPESLNYGKFCIASETPSLKEVGEDIIDYANPYDPVEWAEKIRYYYNNSDELIKKEQIIKERWENTTWEQCAKNISDIFDKILEK